MNALRNNGDRRPSRQQGGAYAVEYAFVFPIFFLLLYGTLAYGMIFTMRLGLQHAAEEGARAALRFQSTGSGLAQQIDARETKAEEIAGNRANWIEGLGPLKVTARICLASVECLSTSDLLEVEEEVPTPPAAPPACGETLADGCQVVVVVSYPYADHPIFPSLPGFGLLYPATLQGRARVLIDGRTLTL